MPAPNQEQLAAIEHSGGVLLSAGAGSGKTFVLKEHMLYLVENWMQEFSASGQTSNEFSSFIKGKFRKVVLMTFTKKAAGELAIRIEKAFKEKLETDSDKTSWWADVVQNLSYLQISTIHGFCFYLIKMGFFPDIAGDEDVISDSEYQKLMTGLFEDFLSEKFSDHFDDETTQLFLNEKDKILESLKSIFGDPALRLAWKQKTTFKTSELDAICSDILKLKGFPLIELHAFPIFEYASYEKKTWYEFAKKFQQETRSFGSGIQALDQYYQFFNNLDYKIPAKPRGKVEPVVIAYYEKIRDFKDFLKSEGENFSLFLQEKDHSVKKWLDIFYELIHFVEAKYQGKSGLTFSDLEYIVYSQFQKYPHIIDQLKQEFSYLIVDEFQDTSLIQYDILKFIIGGDFSKLFCVGDIKQAIYGFRGGELGVFLDCQTRVQQNLSLKNNYRSDKNIIQFNNQLFDYVFEKGDRYEGIDPQAVKVEYQNVPPEKVDPGEVFCVKLACDAIEVDEKLNTAHVEYFEALGLIESIKNNHMRQEETAILYKKLRPSLLLIHLLMDRHIGFTAQIKIPFNSDPLIGLFKLLLEKKFNKNANADLYQLLLIKIYLYHLKGSEFDIEVQTAIDKFYRDEQFYGLYFAMMEFLSFCGVSNSLFEHNLNNLEVLIKSNEGDFEKILLTLEKQSSVSYSFDFCYGENAHLVKIMSAHASKGLQFKNVLLGGIYTNETSLIQRSLLGSIPASFQWSQELGSKKRYKTPHFILEGLLAKEKDLSENKRLFYVANTRAVSSLGWIELEFGELKRTKSQPNAWINGLLKFAASEGFAIEQREVDVHNLYNQADLKRVEKEIPFFHYNPLGSEIKAPYHQNTLLSELSITKMTSLAECPRKFYFQNICKFLPEEMDLIEHAERPSHLVENDELNSQDFLRSSAERGTQIHEALSHYVQHREFGELELTDKNTPQIAWAVEKLNPFFDNFDLISEKPIKFELFGYMVSGIPDLVIQPRDESAPIEVWDFKTGKIKENKLAPYYFQLYCYAYAHYQLHPGAKNKPIKLVLCFVDENEMLEKNVFLEDVEKFLENSLASAQNPEIKNTDYCQYCTYAPVCEK